MQRILQAQRTPSAHLQVRGDDLNSGRLVFSRIVNVSKVPSGKRPLRDRQGSPEPVSGVSIEKVSSNGDEQRRSALSSSFYLSLFAIDFHSYINNGSAFPIKETYCH